MSKIEWTGVSWNPIRAKASGGRVGHFCEKVSPGCAHCYAERLNLTSPHLGTRVAFEPAGIEDVGIELVEKTLVEPLRWRKPRKIFVCSMTDLFLRHHPDEWLDHVFAVMALCSQHTFQVLTKRVGGMLAYLTRPNRDDLIYEAAERIADANGIGTWHYDEWPWSNVWVGVSAEDQERWDNRVPILGGVPASLRWVSAEPLLGPIDPHLGDPLFRRAVDWLVVGGESGPDSRPCDVDAVHRLIVDCDEHEVPCFVKQLGRRPTWGGGKPMTLDHAKGGNPAEWPIRFHVRQFPV